MTIGGWVIMTICVGGVTVFFVWTLVMVLSKKEDRGLHSTRDETPDVHDRG